MSHDAEVRSELHRLARTLPGLLAAAGCPGWTADTSRVADWPPRLKLVRDDAMQIHVMGDRQHPDRLEIHGDSPDDGPYWDREGVHTGSISVTRAKTPEQITGDLRRRLLPQVDAAAQEIKQRQQRHAARVAVVDAAVQHLAEVPGVTGGTPSRDRIRDGQDRSRAMGWNTDAPWTHPRAHVEITEHQGRAEITLEARHLTPAHARAVLAALHQALAQDAAPTN